MTADRPKTERAGSANQPDWAIAYANSRPIPPRDPNAGPAPRPRDAATLILYRRRKGEVEVLMGQRHGGHRFMPNRYVFPGGRIDPADFRVQPASDLPAGVLEQVSRSCTARRARALALAAIRETFEETGLIVGRAHQPGGAGIPAAWREFFGSGFAPDLGGLAYLARAITPPYRPVRFNARFFVVDGTGAVGSLRGSGELTDLQWLPIEEAKRLPIPDITALALTHMMDFLQHGQTWPAERKVPLYRFLHRRHRAETE